MRDPVPINPGIIQLLKNYLPVYECVLDSKISIHGIYASGCTPWLELGDRGSMQWSHRQDLGLGISDMPGNEVETEYTDVEVQKIAER